MCPCPHRTLLAPQMKRLSIGYRFPVKLPERFGLPGGTDGRSIRTQDRTHRRLMAVSSCHVTAAGRPDGRTEGGPANPRRRRTKGAWTGTPWTSGRTSSDRSCGRLPSLFAARQQHPQQQLQQQQSTRSRRLQKTYDERAPSLDCRR
jgi:hypothetical protein